MKIKNFNERKSLYKHIKDAKNLSYDYDKSDTEIVSKILQENKSLMLLNPMDTNLFIRYASHFYYPLKNNDTNIATYKNLLSLFELLNEINPNCERVHLLIGQKCINRRKDFLRKGYPIYVTNDFLNGSAFNFLDGDYANIDGTTIGFIDLKNNLVYLSTIFLDTDKFLNATNNQFSGTKQVVQQVASIVEYGYKITEDYKIEEIKETDLDNDVYSLIYFKTGLN